MKRLLSALVSASLLALSATGCKSPDPSKAHAPRPSFTVGWSVYAGWNPYFYMQKSGILKKWADKYDVDIKLQRFDYAASLDSFVAKNIDACTMTNMEALDMPAASGIDTTALIVGDYSNGNDQVIVRGGLDFKSLPSQKVMLVQKTVSEYLLERGMVINGQADHLKQLQLINTSDSDIAPAFINNKSNQAVVTWKPLVSQILSADKNAHAIFDSSKVPGEILDLLAVRSETLKTPEGQRFAKAITGAWYEAMANFSSTDNTKRMQALKVSADASGDTLPSYIEQLSTTELFTTPQSAVAFDKAPDLKARMDLVRKFCFEHGLLGKGAASADDVGISFPDGSIEGKAANVKLRFNPDYMQAAAEGKL